MGGGADILCFRELQTAGNVWERMGTTYFKLYTSIRGFFTTYFNVKLIKFLGTKYSSIFIFIDVCIDIYVMMSSDL